MGEAKPEGQICRMVREDDDLAREAKQCRHAATIYTIDTPFCYKRMSPVPTALMQLQIADCDGA